VKERAPGYAVAAVVVALASCMTIAMALWTPPEEAGFALSALERAELAGAGLLGALATTMLWRHRRAAPEYFLAWVIAVLAVSLHFSIDTTPRILARIAEIVPGAGLPTSFPASMVWGNLLLNAVLLGLAYWQLAKHRPSGT
jgi:hypothetical protein